MDIDVTAFWCEALLPIKEWRRLTHKTYCNLDTLTTPIMRLNVSYSFRIYYKDTLVLEIPKGRYK